MFFGHGLGPNKGREGGEGGAPDQEGFSVAAASSGIVSSFPSKIAMTMIDLKLSLWMVAPNMPRKNDKHLFIHAVPCMPARPRPRPGGPLFGVAQLKKGKQS